MKVRKTVGLEREGINTTELFKRQLIANHGESTTAYSNDLRMFNGMLQELADKAFQLGQLDGKAPEVKLHG